VKTDNLNEDDDSVVAVAVAAAVAVVAVAAAVAVAVAVARLFETIINKHYIYISTLKLSKIIYPYVISHFQGPFGSWGIQYSPRFGLTFCITCTITYFI
jgi:hypothetical protein